MNYEDLILCESSRRQIYKCLSRSYQLPKEGLNEILQALERHITVLKPQLLLNAELLSNSISNGEELKDLQLDFARLFVGPYSLLAPPYGSLYLEGERRVMGETTIDVMNYYRHAGLEVASTFKEAPDHIATELEFMYFLIHEELRVLGNGDMQCFYDKLCLQQEFLANHLSRWVASFTDTVKNNAQTDFYIHLADLLEIFIAADAENMNELQGHQLMHA